MKQFLNIKFLLIICLLFICFQSSLALDPSLSTSKDLIKPCLHSNKNDSINFKLKGTIRRIFSGKPIEGAEIKTIESGKTIFSDSNGNFETFVTNRSAQLIISHLDYQDSLVSYDLDKRSEINIRLVPTQSQVKHLVFGDTISDFLWDLPLEIINHPKGRTKISLKEYSSNRLIILYTWATWCKPCIENVEKWEAMYSNLPIGVQFMNVHLGNEEVARTFISKKTWKSPTLIGDDCYSLARHFFTKPYVGLPILILDGKLLAIPLENLHDIKLLKEILNGNELKFTTRSEVIYSMEGRAK